MTAVCSVLPIFRWAAVQTEHTKLIVATTSLRDEIDIFFIIFSICFVYFFAFPNSIKSNQTIKRPLFLCSWIFKCEI